MFIYDVINGQGILSKITLKNPVWSGISGISQKMEESSSLIDSLGTNCGNYISLIENKNFNDLIDNFYSELKNIYNEFKNRDLTNFNPNLDIKSTITNFIPTYISNLGEYENTSTYLGRIYEDFNNNYYNIYIKYILTIETYCNIIYNGKEDIKDAFLETSNFMNDAKTNMEKVTNDITDKLNNYSNDYKNYLYGVYYFLSSINIFLIISINVILFFYTRVNNPYKSLKKFGICCWGFSNFFLIISIIIIVVFGILQQAVNDIGDTIDYVFSNENFESETTRLVDKNVENLKICLRGNGDLFTLFTKDNESKTKVKNALNTLYSLYYDLNNETNYFNSIEENSRINLYSISNISLELNNIISDYILAIDNEIYKNNSIYEQFNDLNKYTIAGIKYQKKCIQSSYDYWTTVPSRCPSSTNDYAVQCLYPSDFTDINDINDLYSNTCNLEENSNYYFKTVKEAANNYIPSFNSFDEDNKLLLNEIIPKIENLQDLYKNSYIKEMYESLNDGNNNVVKLVYDFYSKYIDNEPLDHPNETSKEINIFEFMNCTSLGNDFNITLNIMEKRYKKSTFMIFILGIIGNFLQIAIMVFFVFIINYFDTSVIIEKNNSDNAYERQSNEKLTTKFEFDSDKGSYKLSKKMILELSSNNNSSSIKKDSENELKSNESFNNNNNGNNLLLNDNKKLNLINVEESLKNKIKSPTENSINKDLNSPKNKLTLSTPKNEENNNFIKLIPMGKSKTLINAENDNNNINLNTNSNGNENILNTNPNLQPGVIKLNKIEQTDSDRNKPKKTVKFSNFINNIK